MKTKSKVSEVTKVKKLMESTGLLKQVNEVNALDVMEVKLRDGRVFKLAIVSTAWKNTRELLFVSIDKNYYLASEVANGIPTKLSNNLIKQFDQTQFISWA